jgi:hypothetical protein
LNSAAEWAGSIFQVVVDGVESVIVFSPFAYLDARARYSLQQLFRPNEENLVIGQAAGRP